MKLAVVAGEASGDLHAGAVVRELKKLVPDLTAFGLGGDLLAAEGMEVMHHAREMGIVGLFNVIRHLGMFRRVFDELVQRIATEKPDAVLLVDYPDFNLRLAKRCHELGIRVIYFISPQLWAWREGRVKQIARNVDHMLVLFPFEEEFYRKHGVPVTCVGHPLVEQLAHVRTRPLTQDPPPAATPVSLALLPGSRRGEIASLLPPMLDAVRELRKTRPVDAKLILAPTIAAATVEAIARERGVDVTVVDHDRNQAVADADAAISSSGTATLETAIVETPLVVVYRLSRATYWVARRLVRLPHFSLVNIIAGERVVPELIQDEVNGGRLAREVEGLLSPDRYRSVRQKLAIVRARLGEEGAARRAAEKIATLVRCWMNAAPAARSGGQSS